MSARTSTATWTGLAALGLVGAAWLAAEPSGPQPIQLAAHRFDTVAMGLVLAVLAAGALEGRSDRQGLAQRAFMRALALRVTLVALGGAALHLAGGMTSPDWWDHSVLSAAFHLLGPARVMAGQSVVLGALGLCTTGAVLNYWLGVGLGAAARAYVFLAFDVVVFTLLGMAAARGLSLFRTLQVSSRIGLTVAVFSVPVAIYGDDIGYWGVEPFAWIFSAAALLALAALALGGRPIT